MTPGVQVMAGLAAQAKLEGWRTLLVSTDKDLWQVNVCRVHRLRTTTSPCCCGPVVVEYHSGLLTAHTSRMCICLPDLSRCCPAYFRLLMMLVVWLCCCPVRLAPNQAARRSLTGWLMRHGSGKYSGWTHTW